MVANAAPAADRSPSAAASLSIGQVHQRLIGDFPDLTLSKLRFFENKGLIRPARSDSGYRKFSRDDVERIRAILVIQRDTFLPLKKIGEVLDEADRDGLDPVAAAIAQQSVPMPAPSMLADVGELDRRGLVARAGATPALLEQAVSAGLLPAIGPYREEELGMLQALVELEREGIQPRHLRSFRTAAQHELGLIEQTMGADPRRPDGAARERAQEIAERLGSVRRSLVRAALRDPAPRRRA